MVTLGAVVVAAVAVLVPLALHGHGGDMLSASESTTAGHSQAPSGPATIQPYTPPSDGSGWSTQPLDQPEPVPDLFSASDPCAWVPTILPQLKAQVQATGKLDEGGDGCHVYLPHGDIVQIFTMGPYIALTDEASQEKPITIAGLEAREFTLAGADTGSCAVDINSRSFDMTEVDTWNPNKSLDATDRATRCHESETVAQIIAHRFVPLAGGTPASTLQQPTPAVFASQTACQLVQTGDAGYTDIEDQHPTKATTSQGSTCRYTDGSNSVTVLVTNSPTTLDSLHQLPGSVITERKLGPMTARTEQTPMACAEEIALPTGQAMVITYQASPKYSYLAPAACYEAQAVGASAMAYLTDKSAG